MTPADAVRELSVLHEQLLSAAQRSGFRDLGRCLYLTNQAQALAVALALLVAVRELSR